MLKVSSRKGKDWAPRISNFLSGGNGYHPKSGTSPVVDIRSSGDDYPHSPFLAGKVDLLELNLDTNGR